MKRPVPPKPKRKSRMVEAKTVRQGDEVSWSTRVKPRKVTNVEKLEDGKIALTIEDSGRRIYWPDDQLIYLEPLPEPVPPPRDAGNTPSPWSNRNRRSRRRW